MMMRIGIVHVVCAISLLVGISPAPAQTGDITGWHGVPWGSSKAAFRKALGCDPSGFGSLIRCAEKVWLRDCDPVPTSSNPERRRREKLVIDLEKESNAKEQKCEQPDVDQFQIDFYPVNHIDYDVSIVFTKGYGLAGIIMNRDGSDSSAYETALAELRDRYGDPTPASRDNHLEWTWVKPHGNLTMTVYGDGGFIIVYSRKSDKNTL